jgi:hypothetical protein
VAILRPAVDLIDIPHGTSLYFVCNVPNNVLTLGPAPTR